MQQVVRISEQKNLCRNSISSRPGTGRTWNWVPRWRQFPEWLPAFELIMLIRICPCLRKGQLWAQFSLPNWPAGISNIKLFCTIHGALFLVWLYWVIVPCELSLLFRHFLNTTAHYLNRYNLSSPSTKEFDAILNIREHLRHSMSVHLTICLHYLSKFFNIFS